MKLHVQFKQSVYLLDLIFVKMWRRGLYWEILLKICASGLFPDLSAEAIQNTKSIATIYTISRQMH